MADNVVIICNYFDPLFVTLMQRLGFVTCAAVGSEEADYVNVLFSGPTKAYPTKFQGIYELDDFSSHPLPSSGLGTLISSTVFPDIAEASALYEQTPERYFGRMIRNTIWRYCEMKDYHLITLGSESESFALNRYYDLKTTHYSVLDVPDDLRSESSLVVYHKTKDFMTDKRIVAELSMGDDNILLGLFSISNIRNLAPVLAVEYFAKFTSKFIFSYPNRDVLDNWPNGLENIWKEGMFMKQRSFKATYRDWSCRPGDFLNIENAVVITSRDLIFLLKCDEFGNALPELLRFQIDLNDPLFYLWFFVIGKDLLSVQVQTWFNSQTNYARYVSIPLRNMLRLEENTLHIVRARVFGMLFEDKDPILIDSLKINGSYLLNGERKYVAVSGHLVNLLLYSTCGLVDFKRYLDTVESNVKFSSGIKPSALESYYLRNDLLAEDNGDTKSTDLWHTYDDYFCAIGTYIYMCSHLKHKLNLRAIVYSLRRLKLIRSKYVMFSSASSDALEYIREEKDAGR